MGTAKRPATPRMAVHFGVRVQTGSKYGLRINRDTYATINKRSSIHIPRELNPKLWDLVADSYEDEDHRILTDEWCENHQARALQNYDLNMAYFASLDVDEFNEAVTGAVAAQRGMVEITDLNDWDGVGGLYVMVLDDYRQAYVGVTEGAGGIKGRIRQHWRNSKPFDRLLWGDVSDSILSVDSFRALDTTRIFAGQVRNPVRLENKVIDSFPSKFLLNRVAGGDGRMLGFAMAMGMDVIKTRPLESLNQEEVADD